MRQQFLHIGKCETIEAGQAISSARNKD